MIDTTNKSITSGVRRNRKYVKFLMEEIKGAVLYWAYFTDPIGLLVILA